MPSTPVPARDEPDVLAAGRVPAADPKTADARARRSRALVTAGVVALVVLGLAWELWLAPTGSGTLAIKVLPLLPALPGLWRYRLYTYRWLSLLVWIYAGEGLLRATSESGPAVPLAVAELALAMLVFVGCVDHVRGRLASARGGAAKTAAGAP